MTIKIYLDPGHGGSDSGAQGNGLQEKNLTLTICKKIEKLLKNYQDVQVRLSRTTDKYLSLNERTNDANSWGANALISVHINSATTTSAKGFESFIWNGSVSNKTIALQNMLHAEIMKKIVGIGDRGKKRANFHMCRESNMSAVLTENLFIINSSDASKLKDDNFLDKLAEGHVNGLVNFFGLKLKPEAPTEPIKTTTGVNVAKTLYKVQVGAFSSLENAKGLEAKLKKEGYNVYIVEE